MKFFSIIFALYIFTLNIYPCADSDLAQVPHETLFEKIPHKHDTSENDTQENCSPFCVCDCSTVVNVHYAFQISFTLLPAVETIELPVECNKKPQSISLSIWHPPTQTV